MKEFLNVMFGPKGLEFLDIIITEVQLPDDVKGPLDMKAQYASFNEMERERYNFDMRLINDAEALELIKQDKYQERDSIAEEFSKQMTMTSRDLEVIRANAVKSVAEINEQAKAETAQIEAEAERKNQEVRADTLITKAVDETKGQCEAKLISVEAANTAGKLMAAKEFEIASLKAQTIQTVGEAESAIATVMQSRRKYEYLNKKLETIEQFKDNKNLHVFGDNNDDVLAQLAAFRINQG